MPSYRTFPANAAAFAALLYASAASAQTEEMVIVSQPVTSVQASGAASTQVFTRAALEALPYDRLDAALAAQSSFSLFRRTPSISANPTIQGATLRGIGPNGAGRAAVLLDGAPLNDPFGNWVNWSALPLGTISQVVLERGGRPISGGPGALSGLIALESGSAQKGQRLSLSGTTLEGFDAAFTHAGKIGGANIIASASGGQRQGYVLLPEDQRGPADVPTASYNAAGSVKISAPLSGEWRGAILLRGFTEGRDNGLDGATNSTDGFDGSIRFSKPAAAGRWGADITAYGQIRHFENLFTAVDAARETTRPVLDQFSVPSYAFGLRSQAQRQWGAGRTTTVFVQLDQKSGETREGFRNFGSGFTRERRAGGKQQFYGLGLLHAEPMSDTISIEAGLRLDGARLSDGSRIETDTATGAELRNDSFETRSDVVPGGELGVTWTPLPAWRLNARGYTGYRLPSLNEFFRPFRVGNDITEANPELEGETLRGVDVSARFEPISGQFLDITFFHNWLNDAVGNISVAGEVGGVIAPCGFVPGGGSCRQRGNIDRITVFGAEVLGGMRLSKALRLLLNYGYTDASVQRDGRAPGLAGNRLAQVPRHRGALTALWTPAAAPISASITARAQSAQFEDDLNERSLSGFVALDISAQWRIASGMQLRLDIVNLTNSEIEAGLSGAGIVTRGQPLTASAGIDIQF